VVDSLKVLDPQRPIREADMGPVDLAISGHSTRCEAHATAYLALLPSPFPRT
jgi:hypothetical protein